jgi:hypothetical protein
MRAHFLERHGLGENLLAAEMHIGVGRLQFFQAERLGRQHLVAGRRNLARLRAAVSADEAAEVFHQQS